MPDCPRCGSPRSSAYCSPCQVALVRSWERRNPERSREIKNAAKRRWAAKKRAEARARRPVVVAQLALTLPEPTLCSRCSKRMEMYDGPLGSDHCYDCLTHWTCTDCGETKPLDEFAIQRTKRTGRTSYCKPCGADRRRRWAKENPGKVRRNRWKVAVDRHAIFERDEGVCHLCGDPAERENFHLDHVVPRARGGSDDPSNLKVSHPACNMAKGARILVGGDTAGSP